ncbi:hypothetical protein GCM10010402_22040 [Actinomadura luteofluorescens]|uniref:hypothetical protein n=1 Tax=Actinomadura luteofluorescens TaxID=46163 RepID=UPI002164ECE1|nr:hypothetical protein [Actinomadura glauciflava]MCR3744556.1 hypothetical protein [Actinomadura glauciflava]
MKPGKKGAEMIRARSGWWAAAVLATVLLLATLMGGGRVGLAVAAADGSAWLWSRSAGEVDRVNPDSGKVDQRRAVTDSRGHRVQVTQNDRFLLIHDLDTGRVSSLDLNGLGFSGRLDIGTRGDPHLAMGSDGAALVERTTGAVRALDPATLRPVGPVLQLPGPLVGGEFDDAGLLWVAVPRQGTVIALKVSPQGASVVRTAEAAPPDHDLTMTVLDQGALVVDRGGRDLVVATGDGTRRVTAPVPLTGAMVPERTHGALAAVTVPGAGSVVTLGDVRKGGPVRSFPLTDPVQEPAVPFAGKVYLPVRETGQVRVFEPAGRQTGMLSMPAGRGDMELQVREGNLFVNSPGSTDALVVGGDGVARKVGKFPGGPGRGGERPGRPGGEASSPPLIPAPPADPVFPDPFDPIIPPQRPEAPVPTTSESPPAGRTETPRPPAKPGSRTPSPRTPSRTPTTAPTTQSPPRPTPPTRTTSPTSRPTTPRPTTPRPTTPRPTPTKPKPTPTKPKPTPTKPKPKPTQTRNPYTPAQVCNATAGGNYQVQRSASFPGGRIYQLYSASTKKNCAVTMKTTDIGKGTNAWIRLQSQKGGKVASDNGTFKYYAGPVFVLAPGDCVRYSGGASGASASSGWGNCG